MTSPEEEAAYNAYLDAVAQNRTLTSNTASGAIDPWTGRPYEYNARAAQHAANAEQLAYENYLASHYQAVGGVQTSTGGGGEATGKSQNYGDNPTGLGANAAPGDIPSWQGSTPSASQPTSTPSYTEAKYGIGVTNPITGVTVYENTKTSPDYVPFSSPVAQYPSSQLIREGVNISEQQAANINYAFETVNAFNKANANTNLPAPYGMSVTSLGIIGTVDTNKRGMIAKNEPPPMMFAPVGNPLLDFGLTTSKAVDDMFGGVQKAIPHGMMTSPIKAVLGFAEMIPQTLTFVPIVAGSAFMLGQQPSATIATVPRVAVDTATGMWERATTEPERAFGNLVGMRYAPEIIEGMGSYALERAPMGVGVAKIPTSVGSESTILFGYTKGLFEPMERANIRAWVGLDAQSEASMLVSSKSFLKPASGITFQVGKVPTFGSVGEAVTYFDNVAGKKGTYLHGSTSAAFTEQVLKSGGVTADRAVFFGKEGTVYTRFLQGGESIPGGSSLIRIVESPKTPLETSVFGGNVKNPILPEGLYPGTKPLSGVKYKGGLQNEFLIPQGTELSLKGMSYIEAGGSKIPVMDMQIGKASLFDKANVAIQKFETHLNTIQMPEMGFGKPTPFLKTLDISMWNPLEEVAAKQWTPSQKAIMNPYMEEMALKPGATSGLQTAIAGRKALPLYNEVSFVQREPVGQILAGREMSEATIGKLFKNRESFGSDVYSGGSTAIRANLGKSFFNEKIIGDIDAWATGKRVAELQKSEIGIIKADQPSVVRSRLPGLQEGFPVAEVRIAGATKPLTEIHSIEAFPAVSKAKNVVTMKAVGGADVTAPSTSFFGGLRKSSAMFDKEFMTQKPGGVLEIGFSEKNIKHAVGASAVAKEAASLLYGRDAAITGMKPSFSKGMAMERYAAAIDKMLGETKGATRKEAMKYQTNIEQNPLQLAETKTAKAKAYVAEGNLPISKILGIGLSDVKTPRVSYPSAYNYPKSTRSGILSGIPGVPYLGYGSKPTTTTKSQTYPIPMMKTPSFEYPTVTSIYKEPSPASAYTTGKITPYTSIPSITPPPGSLTPYTPPPPVTRTPYTPTPPYTPTRYPPTGYPPTTRLPPTTRIPPPGTPPRISPPEKYSPIPSWYPVPPRKKNEDESSNLRKLKKKQAFREIIPIERGLFPKIKTQDFERRYTILKGTQQVVGGLVPPEFGNRYLPGTQNYRATRGKGWIEAEPVLNVPPAPSTSRPQQTYQRKRLPEPAMGVLRNLFTVYKGTGGRISARPTYTPPVKLRPVRGKSKKKGWLL